MIKRSVRISRSVIRPVVLILAALLISTKDMTVGEFWFQGDSPRHALDGVFFLDLARDFPITHLYQYAAEYYAHYPALGLLHYEPFFPVVEAVLFALLGVSVFAARLTVLLFWIIGLIFWYKLINEIYESNIAFFSGLLLATTPMVVLFSKTVMLEIPSLSMGLVAVYFFYRYVECDDRRALYLCAIFSALAVLTKKHLFIMVPIFTVYLWLRGKCGVLFSRQSLFGLSIFVILVGPYNYLALRITGRTFMNSNIIKDGLATVAQAPFAFLIVPDTYFYYIRTLPQQVGTIVLVLATVSLLIMILTQEWQKHRLFLVWIVTSYIVMTLIAHKQLRYIIFWTPPFALFATLALSRLRYTFGSLSVSTVGLAAICLVEVGSAWRIDRPLAWSGLEPAARYVTAHQDRGTTVLVDSGMDGNFVFFVRQYDPERKMLVLRGSKVLYYTDVRLAGVGLVEAVHTQDELYEMTRRYGIRWFVIQDKPYGYKGVSWGSYPKIAETLRDFLRSDNFALVREFPFPTGAQWGGATKVQVFEFKGDVPPKSGTIRIPMPEIGGEIIVGPGKR